MDSFIQFVSNHLGPILIVLGVATSAAAFLAWLLFRESDGVITYAYFVPGEGAGVASRVVDQNSHGADQGANGHFVVVIANQWETEHPGPLRIALWPRSGRLNGDAPLQLRFGPLNRSATVRRVDNTDDQRYEIALPTGLPPFRMLAIDVDARDCANLEVEVTLPRPWYMRWLNLVVDRVVPSIDAAGLFHAVGQGARLRVASSATWVELGPKLARFHRARERWSAVTACAVALVAFFLAIQALDAVRTMKPLIAPIVEPSYVERGFGVGVWPLVIGVVLIAMATWAAYTRGSASFVMAEPYRHPHDPFAQKSPNAGSKGDA